MYVCVCSAVTEKQIHKAIEGGVRTLRELRHQLGVTIECGRCARCAHDCLRASAGRAADADAGQQPVRVHPSYPLVLEAT